MKHLPKDRGACLWRLSSKFQSMDLFRINYSNYSNRGDTSVCVKGGKNITIVRYCSILNAIQGLVLHLTAQTPEMG